MSTECVVTYLANSLVSSAYNVFIQCDLNAEYVYIINQEYVKLWYIFYCIFNDTP